MSFVRRIYHRSSTSSARNWRRKRNVNAELNLPVTLSNSAELGCTEHHRAWRRPERLRKPDERSFRDRRQDLTRLWTTSPGFTASTPCDSAASTATTSTTSTATSSRAARLFSAARQQQHRVHGQSGGATWRYQRRQRSSGFPSGRDRTHGRRSDARCNRFQVEQLPLYFDDTYKVTSKSDAHAWAAL